MTRGGCAAVVAVCLAGGAAAPGCGGGDDGAGSPTHEGEAGLPIAARFRGNVPGVSASLDGADLAPFLIDTGSPIMLADTDDHDLDDGWHVLDLELGDLHFSGVQVGAFDVFKGGEAGSAPFSGIIGGSLLTDFALSFDPQGGRVWLEDGPPAELPAELAAGAVGPAVEVDAQVGGGGRFMIAGEVRPVGATRFLVRVAVEDQDDQVESFWALVDSGASSVVLSNELMDLLGDGGRPRLDGVVVQTASGSKAGYLTRVWSLRLPGADDRIEQTSAPVMVLPDDDLFESVSAEVGQEVRGIVGGSFLRWYVATLDYAAEAMRLLPYVSPDHIDPDEFVGLGFDIDHQSGAWVIDAVFGGTDAEARDVRVGDTLVSVDGTAVGDLDESDIDGLTRGGGVGTVVAIALERRGADGPVEVDADVAVEDLLPAFDAP
jgi:hypothetical protein